MPVEVRRNSSVIQCSTRVAYALTRTDFTGPRAWR